jgi:hypothetical protein
LVALELGRVDIFFRVVTPWKCRLTNDTTVMVTTDIDEYGVGGELPGDAAQLDCEPCR